LSTPECKAEYGHVFYNGRGRTRSVKQAVDDVHAGCMHPYWGLGLTATEKQC